MICVKPQGVGKAGFLLWVWLGEESLGYQRTIQTCCLANPAGRHGSASSGKGHARQAQRGTTGASGNREILSTEDVAKPCQSHEPHLSSLDVPMGSVSGFRMSARIPLALCDACKCVLPNHLACSMSRDGPEIFLHLELDKESQLVALAAPFFHPPSENPAPPPGHAPPQFALLMRYRWNADKPFMNSLTIHRWKARIPARPKIIV